MKSEANNEHLCGTLRFSPNIKYIASHPPSGDVTCGQVTSSEYDVL
jgi:hypothetical protein